MAEIPIQRKESRNWLPLLLLGLLLLAILGYCFLRPHPVAPVVAAGDSTRTATVSADTTRAAAVPAAGGDSSAVARYAQFVQQRDTTKETEGQHAYTAEGIRRLAAALDQVAGQNGSAAIAVYADSMRSSVDRLQRSSPKDVHAEDAKAAFSAAVSAMTVIDKAQGRTYDVAPMRTIYNRLSPAKPLMPQLGTVEQFFTSAGTALQTMNVPGANAAGSAAGAGTTGAGGAAGTGAAGTGATGTGTGTGTSGSGQ